MPQPDDSNNKQVSVAFDPTTGMFTFNPSQPVVFDRPGKLILQKDNPSDQSWQLSGVLFDGGGGDQFPIESRSGQRIVIDDDFLAMGTYSYEVQVTANNTTYTSPDPQIINQNPQATL